MTVTQQELDDFHQFASQRIRNSSAEISFDDVVIEWESLRDRDSINAAICKGLADVNAGHHRPAEEVMEELRQKYGIESE